ncbi:CheR family methyltransferase [Alkalimarinus alittae]|uniref:Chemotaxis protein methyltransferase n=1 Tax=Alkalimarinus alittae TaxID=2961619 RepID=A0ABY6N6L4_9ALTE|nr:protein-glutamate O-methyltransferase CheR [Alkalimarinus alittae]UZE97763.1 protein-glutamate O-methyltransferase CheR [Alkalimarinus alittae]
MTARLNATSSVSVDEYQLFRDFLQQACGILLGDNKQYLVTSRLRKIMEQEGIESLGVLVQTLKKASSRALKETVVDAMTTNETLWFRDNHPFRILSDILLPEFSERGGIKPVRIWSAACSTGQEPYSMTMVAEEFKRAKPGKLKSGIKVVATDISQTVLANAKSGEYEMLAIGRGLSKERLNAYFVEKAPGVWKVKPDLMKHVEFRLLNLLDRYSILGKFDVIFCRNVLIYFSAELKLDILSRMHQALNKGGYLVLGASESLNGLSDKFEMIQCRPGIIYRAI